jgi:hypothetical protein
MSVASPFHFFDQCGMTTVECSSLAPPSLYFWMITVSFFVVDQDAPDGMQLAVFAEQMESAEFSRRNIPDAHVAATLERL